MEVKRGRKRKEKEKRRTSPGRKMEVMGIGGGWRGEKNQGRKAKRRESFLQVLV